MALGMGLCWFMASAQIDTERTLQSGRAALYFEDPMVAIQYFNQVVDAKPFLPEPYFLRAIAKYNLSDFTGAQRDASKALELNPFLPDAWEVRGVANQCLGNSTSAISDYRQALTLLPHNRQLLFNLALAQESADQFSAADTTYEELLALYPRFDNGYLGRAQLNLHRADTIAARADLDKALDINANSLGALSMSAALAADPIQARELMERAVTLAPDKTFLRVNRSIARYKANDLNGALDDLDYVVAQEPTNYEALFNRAMLRCELGDFDRALPDLDLALRLRPNDLKARLNRAMVLYEKKDYQKALDDINRVYESFPEMFAGVALRGQIHQAMGNTAEARRDFHLASQLAHSTKINDEMPPEETDDALSRFRALQAADDSQATAAEQSFNARGIKAHTAPQAKAAEMQPIYQLTYYVDPDAPAVYDKEIDDLNAARVLPLIVFLSNSQPRMESEKEAAKHFESIRRLTAAVQSGQAHTADYFARAMDFTTLKAYPDALNDLNEVILRQKDFAPAYLQRAAVRYRIQESGLGNVIADTDAATLNARSAMTLQQIMDDLDHALTLNPRMAAAHYNRGVILLRLGAWADAIDAFTAAVDIDPTLGPAYFNRGFANFERGNQDEAIADISRAGQLGVHAAYPLLKQIRF